MGLDHPSVRDAGAGLNEILDDRGAHADVDEEGDCEDEADDCSSHYSTNQEEEANITIRAISSYGPGNILATPQDLSLKPGAHLPEEEKDHLISAGFVARISGHDLQTVLGWARTGSLFLKLEFHLTGNDLPRFTLRVKVVENQHEDISLSGGLGFALRLLKFVKTMDLDGSVSRKPPCPPPIAKRRLHHLRAANQRHQKVVGLRRQPRPFSSSDLERLERIHQSQAACIQSQTAPPPLSSSLSSLGETDDQDSVFSFSDQTEDSMEAPPLTTATTATSSYDACPEYPRILEDFSENFAETYSLLPGLKRQELPVDPFEQQKMRAEAMYAHNGDTSGLVSVMALATAQPLSSHPESFWYPQQH
ncbi:hypothetical protein QBC37DRAFT_73619 [Rhypophila decipiens]|uniref:Uncharacterized protein n=1 Tax=Rhypophila decipiens TaxID=261697 RepID=A0AAN6YPA9_9PEZI|nr:hypothetical protein QBC37DRAFT_73619 [Rhypophila decipiens]